MSNAVPEITVQDFAQKLRSPDKFSVLDVRETWEINLARLTDDRLVLLPMSQIGRDRQAAFPAALLDPQTEIVVMCHHGVRSADVTRWMQQQGWQNVRSLQGGIAAYAEEIDPSVGRY